MNEEIPEDDLEVQIEDAVEDAPAVVPPEDGIAELKRQLDEEQLRFVFAYRVDGGGELVVGGFQAADGQSCVHVATPVVACFRAAFRRWASSVIQRAQTCWSGRSR